MKTRLASLKVQLAGLILLVAGSGLYCLSKPGCSLLTPDQQGYYLFKQQQYETAATRFADPMWRGIALFRNGDFEPAASLFAGYDTAEAAFAQGNALVMQGKYEAAVDRYARALQLQPGWEEATVNQEIALLRAEALKREGGEGTGGKLGADEIVFNQGKAPPSAGEEQVEAGFRADGAEQQAIWLRQVQTRPADFLRAKFAHQYATRAAGVSK
jgi:Ca-activated chloride channel family protein